MTELPRIPTFQPCQHRWVGRTLKWCPDCDLVQSVDEDVWSAGWASGWAEAIARLRIQLQEQDASTYVRSTVQKAVDAISEDVMPR